MLWLSQFVVDFAVVEEALIGLIGVFVGGCVADDSFGLD